MKALQLHQVSSATTATISPLRVLRQMSGAKSSRSRGGEAKAAVFVAAMVGGMLLFDLIERRSRSLTRRVIHRLCSPAPRPTRGVDSHHSDDDDHP